MKLVLLILNLVILSACIPTKVESEISSGKINADAPFEWSSGAFPRNLRISDQFTPEEVANIEEMSSAWETALENKKNFFDHGTIKATEVSGPNLNLDEIGKDGVSGIYKIMHWPTSLPGSALAVTQIFGYRYNIGKPDEYVLIQHADILLNQHMYNFRTDDSKSNDTYDLRTVMLHEMGHFLGLGHKYGDTIMNPTVTQNVNKRSPTHIDITDLADKYGINLFINMNMNMALSNKRKTYAPAPGDQGLEVKILIELMADGECVHKENGVTTRRHPAHLN